MFDRNKFFLILNQDPNKWAEKYDIEPFETTCANCPRIRKTNTPFFTNKFRGLIATKCECGEPNPPYCIVSIENDDILKCFRSLE